MCTIKQLKEWLEQFPDEANVEVLEEYSGSYDLDVRFTPLKVDVYDNTWSYLEGKPLEAFPPTLYLGNY